MNIFNAVGHDNLLMQHVNTSYLKCDIYQDCISGSAEETTGGGGWKENVRE
jgi:hypothetical protein